MSDAFDWIDEREEEIKEERAAGYFDIKEGKQQFVLLSHCARLSQVFDPTTKKYRAAQEGDRNASIKGVCWVMHDGQLKQAKLPYTVVKTIRAYSQKDENGENDWDFKIPFPHTLTLEAIGAGTKEVKYSLIASPKVIVIPQAILDELATKSSPDEIVEKIKSGKTSAPRNTAQEDTREVPAEEPANYPQSEVNDGDIPF